LGLLGSRSTPGWPGPTPAATGPTFWAPRPRTMSRIPSASPGRPTRRRPTSSATSSTAWSTSCGRSPPRKARDGVRVVIGTDHAGFELKEHVIDSLKTLGHDVDDLGTHSTEPVDYPPICAEVAQRVAKGDADRGIVLGGSGQGEQIAANKVRGIRAALCNDLYAARYSRLHNDANVLSIGGRVVGTGLADEILRLWLATEFEGGRHVRRIEEIAEIEEGE